MNQKLNCILVIDDDEPTNFFTRMILEESGCAENIITVQSGQDALDYLTRSENSEGTCASPDLIFLDINMPAMDGWEFLELYRRLNIHNRIIVVMLTTSLFPEDKSKAESTPEISGFENKPLTEEKILGIVEKYFARMASS
jgi:CheY-like chemotaxis protein